MADGIAYTLDETGNPIALYPDGTIVGVVAPEPTPNPATHTIGGTSVTAPQGTDSTNTGQSGTTSPTYYTQGDGAGGYQRGGRSYANEYDSGDPFARLPQFGTGASHPAAGGRPLTPGGQFNTGEPSYRQQVSVPGGAAAGPFETRGAYPPSQHSYGGDSAGGGGGGASALYYKVRDRLESLGSGGGSSYSSGSSYGSSYPETKEPKEERMRGPYARGLDPSQAMGLSLRPTAMLPKAMPGLSGASPFYGLLSELPAAQLAPLMRRGYDGGPSDLANATGRFYERAGQDMNLPETDALLRNLFNPKNTRGIDQMFGGVKAGKGDYESQIAPGFVYGQEPMPAGTAASTVQGMLDAIFTSTLPAPTATAASAYANYLVDKGTARVMKRPAGKGRSLNELVGRKFRF